MGREEFEVKATLKAHELASGGHPLFLRAGGVIANGCHSQLRHNNVEHVRGQFPSCGFRWPLLRLPRAEARPQFPPAGFKVIGIQEVHQCSTAG